MSEDFDEIDVPPSTTELSKEIKPIAKDTVHRICSGQVVLSLAIAAKELVENSIDAGATLVEVKFKDQGIDSIEVSDNGCGVEENNLEGLTAKYHTSKIREFSDLVDVETFGFRGEALSSLCALSEMIITTRFKTANIGTRLELDHNGKIKKKVPCARQVGTTVILTKLFASLPVRKREFVKNIKREFTKMCQVLQAYGMVSKGVRIICTNQTPKGVKSTLISTHGSQNILDNIVSIFGAKQAADLIQIKPPILENEKFNKDLFSEVLQDENTSLTVNPDDIDNLNLNQYKFEGWISSCSHGCGRGSKDRQYFFINSRPCDPKNISKIVNEIYHRYNIQQSPFVFLNLIMERSEVDVNLTPDKRQLLVNNEKILLLAIKKSLVNTFGNIPSTFKLNNTLIKSPCERIKPIKKLNKEQNSESEESENECIEIPNSQNFMQKLSQWKATGHTIGPLKPLIKTKRKQDDEITSRNLKLRKIQEYLSQPTIPKQIKADFSNYNSDPDSENEEKSEILSEMSFSISQVEKESKNFEKLFNPSKPTNPRHKKENNNLNASEIYDENKRVGNSDSEEEILESQIVCKVVEPRKSEQFFETRPINSPINQEKCCTNSKENSDESDSDDIIESNSAQTEIPSIVEFEIDSSDNDDEGFVKTQEFYDEIQISIDEIKALVIAEETYLEENKERTKIDRLKFQTEINPNKNKNAEEELEREISKEMFSKMSIIGQFNLGFIIVLLDHDLFIIDQHASDEKYNFENLQKTVILQYQQLTVPENLEISAVDEMILMDNIKIFEANGFKFQINENGPPTKKIKLLSKPFSKNWEFGKDDIADLIFMLQDAPKDTMCRPPRIRDMFASRACRKSVMIGKALNKTTMRKLVDHMGEIEHPWNCPHGRPTMRHLINLAMLDDKEE